MTSPTQNKSEKLVCETCQRPLGKAQLNCPRRGFSGIEGCPYQLEIRSHTAHYKPAARYLPLIIGLGLLLLWVSPQLGSPRWNFAALWVYPVPGLAAILFWLIWAYRNFGKTLSSRNAQRGVEVIETSLFGIQVQQIVIGPNVTVPWEGSPARRMRYPASVVELYRGGRAADLIATAILQLAAQGAVQVGYVRIRWRFLKSKVRYCLLPSVEGVTTSAGTGKLEKKILGLVRNGAMLDDLIPELFGGGKPHPRNYLVDEIIGPEAEAFGLGEVRGHLQREFVSGPNTRGRIAVDIQSVDNLYRDFWMNLPEHAREMLIEIDRQVIAMVRAETRPVQSSKPSESSKQ